MNDKELQNNTSSNISLNDCKIIDQAIHAGKRLLIFDYMNFSPDSPAKNLHCYDDNNKLIWIAENPTDQKTDAYYNFSKLIEWTNLIIIANNFAGYECHISVSTGKIIKYKATY
jgi:hypothetical protein